MCGSRAEVRHVSECVSGLAQLSGSAVTEECRAACKELDICLQVLKSYRAWSKRPEAAVLVKQMDELLVFAAEELSRARGRGVCGAAGCMK